LENMPTERRAHGEAIIAQPETTAAREKRIADRDILDRESRATERIDTGGAFMREPEVNTSEAAILSRVLMKDEPTFSPGPLARSWPSTSARPTRTGCANCRPRLAKGS
jgi:hypothetical protein